MTYKVALVCFVLCVAGMAAAQPPNSNMAALKWKLQSGCIVHASGDLISSPAYHPEAWIEALVPGTVLGSQVEAGIFPDPFFGMNLRKVPGTDYPIRKIFGYLPMSADSPYRCPWWYRTEFVLPPTLHSKTWVHFNGINYRANIWVNGKRVAVSDQIAGAFRSYDFDISKEVVRGRNNSIAVEVFAQTENDLGIDFLDWNPAPADKSLGLWRSVSLLSSGPVTLRYPAVSTHFTTDDLSEAELHIVVDAINSTDHPIHVRVTANLGAVHIHQSIELAAHETRAMHFEPESFPALRVKHPDLWWPYQYGEPHLQHIHLTAEVDGHESDTKTATFGIREITAALNQDRFLQFQINRRNILIRGGGWAPDLFYREPRNRLRQELDYVRDMHLNTIRLEGKLGSDDLFELADQMGILIMAGWQCCDAWQSWDKWTPADHAIAHASTYSQISRLRSHPSSLVWLNGSDEVPSPEVEKDSLAVLKERDWPNPIMSTAADRVSALTGASGVKMSGPYDYVPPEYWYLDKSRFGGAFGFNTETSPGPAVPPVASIERTLPKASWWPIDEQWTYHAGLGKFAQVSNFTNAMNSTYGAATSLENYSLKAQLMAYDGERAMFEAYGDNKYRSTGVIQWMLNNAWPSFIWHLYDYYLVPGGGYFGTKKANEPLHIQYRYDDRIISVVNSTLTTYKGMHATATMLGVDGKEILTQRAMLDLNPDSVVRPFALPLVDATHFLDLTLTSAEGQLESENFYWIPAKLAELNWDKTTYVNTPALHYSNMQDLAQLPEADVHAALRSGSKPGDMSILLHNAGATIAFFLSLRALDPEGNKDLAPVFWNDNYVSLLPGQSKILSVHGLANTKAIIILEGWNIKPRTIYP
jgi:exo-1,4-beta-D-glucosaminidase